MSVNAICQSNVVLAQRDDSVLAAARLMRDEHVGCVVVVDDVRRPVGVLTDRDIVVAVLALDLDPEEIAVGDVMSDQVVTIAATADVLAALETMRAAGVRRLPVTDAEGKLVGILSSDDVLDGLATELGDLARIVSREQDQERVRRRVKV